MEIFHQRSFQASLYASTEKLGFFVIRWILQFVLRRRVVGLGRQQRLQSVPFSSFHLISK